MKVVTATKRISLFIVFFVLQSVSQAQTNVELNRGVYTNRNHATLLSKPNNEKSFTFAIFGDRTKGSKDELKQLKKAVAEINIIRPDFVMTVGDLINGSKQLEIWISQAAEYKTIMNKLEVPWYPVAGNHDIYKGNAKQTKKDYTHQFEKSFGPVWYAFEHKNCWFVVLFTDEGNPITGIKTWKQASSQRMSPQQTQWLTTTLNQAHNANHIFVFQHHPRWEGRRGGNNYGNDWARTHELLTKAGNVSAVFAGHLHRMVFGGKKNGIEYHTLAVTGGSLNKQAPSEGFLHHYDLVTVRGDQFHVATIPVGTIVDKKKLTASNKKVSRKTAKKARRKKSVVLQEKQTVLVNKKFMIDSEEHRQLTFPLTIPPSTTLIQIVKIGIHHAKDDTGDGGLEYRILDPFGNLLEERFISSKNWDWITQKVPSGSTITLELVDKDTKFTGRNPGNGGTVKVLINGND